VANPVPNWMSFGLVSERVAGDNFGVEAKNFLEFRRVFDESPFENLDNNCAHGSTFMQCYVLAVPIFSLRCHCYVTRRKIFLRVSSDPPGSRRVL
jgi:hypothetical protein